MKKTIMVTGASGFIGTNFISKYKDIFNIIPICLIENKPEELNYKGVDCILHLAALVHQMNGAPDEKYFEINTELTRRLAIKAREEGVKHFVFYSSVKVYGYDGNLTDSNFILGINSECHPTDPYGKSKYEAEKILNSLKDENFKVSIIRPPMVYGSGVKGNMLNLIKLVEKVSILPFNYDEFKRSIVSIDNLLFITSEIIEYQKEGIVIPQDDKTLSIKEIVEGIGNSLNKKIYLFRFPKPIFKLMCKMKPNIMIRLYGGLQFEKTEKTIESTKNGLKKMIEN